MHSYKIKHPSFEKRKADCQKVIEKYPTKIPVIVELYSGGKAEAELPPLDKNMFLLPNDLSCHQFMYLLRKRMKLHEKDALFMAVNRSNMAKGDQMIQQIYDKNKDEDGYLYITLTSEPFSG